MRLKFDSAGYVCCVLYGCTIDGCAEYEGGVPTEPEVYADIDDWADRAKVQAYYLNDVGNLIYDADRAANLPDENAVDPYTSEQVKSMGIVDVIYPVGSIYMSVNDASPDTLFGGTWERIEDRFLFAASTWGHPAGVEGGSETAEITIEAHKHTINTYDDVKFVSGAVTSGSYDIPITGTTNSAGGDTITVSTMPPYLAVYMWKRTA